MVFATEKYHYYLFGNYFKGYSDHEPLLSILNNPEKKAPIRIEQMRVNLKELCHLPDWLVSFDYSQASR